MRLRSRDAAVVEPGDALIIKTAGPQLLEGPHAQLRAPTPWCGSEGPAANSTAKRLK